MTEHHNNQHAHFIVPVKYYVGTFAALLLLTVVTVAVAQFDFGAMNIVIAMAVAVAKASLVAAIFMGLKWDKKINLVFFVSSLIFLGIFLGYALLDINYRKETDSVEQGNFGLVTPVKKSAAHHKN